MVRKVPVPKNKATKSILEFLDHELPEIEEIEDREKENQNIETLPGPIFKYQETIVMIRGVNVTFPMVPYWTQKSVSSHVINCFCPQRLVLNRIVLFKSSKILYLKLHYKLKSLFQGPEAKIFGRCTIWPAGSKIDVQNYINFIYM